MNRKPGSRTKKTKKQARKESFLYFENILWSQGVNYIAGVDEAGMGALAGPVVAAAVVFSKDTGFFRVDDSKKLTPAARETVSEEITHRALSIGIGEISAARINELGNIYLAGLEAMRAAVMALKKKPDHILVDGRVIADIDIPQSNLKKGDSYNFTIAAASVIAKVHRDNIMRQFDKDYPGYELARHKGYATSRHVACLKELGPCRIHRTSYDFVKGICGQFSDEFFEFDNKINKVKNLRDIARLNKELSRLTEKMPAGECRRLQLRLKRRRKYFGSKTAAGVRKTRKKDKEKKGKERK